MTRLLTDLLRRAESPELIFDAEAVAEWPVGGLDQLIRLGLLAETDPASVAVCDSCGFDHVELVDWVRVPNRKPRAFIPCPVEVRVQVDPARLKRWSVRLSNLADAVARVLRSQAESEQRIPGRIWRLGTVHIGGRAFAGFLAVGLNRPDAASVVASVPELQAANAVVFVPATTPALTLWGDSRPTVIPLTDFLSLGPNGLAADHTFLESAIAPLARLTQKTATSVFPTARGTTWEQVELVVEDHRVVVRVGDVSRAFGFAEAGFEDRRKKNVPDEVWGLLGMLAQFSGVLGTGDDITTKPGELKRKVTELRKRLRALLGIDADPMASTGRGKAYRARFAIRCTSGATFPTPAGATWADITLTETTPGIIEVSISTTEMGIACVVDDAEGEAVRREATTSSAEQMRRYALAQLGLSASDGETLLAVLRAGGRLTRPATDAGLLRLGKALGVFFQLSEPPFEFDSARRVWTATFEALSLVPVSDR